MEYYELEDEWSDIPLPSVRFGYELDFMINLVHTHTNIQTKGQFIELTGETELLDILELGSQD